MQDYLGRAVKEFLQLPPSAFPIKCFENDELGRFWIRIDGELLSVCDEQPLYKSFTDNGKGYQQVKINGKSYYKHRLIAFAFNAVEEKKYISINDRNYVVHHMDFNRENNNLSNLCIMPKEKHDTIHRLYNKWQKCEDC